MFEVRIRTSFSAAHHLVGYRGACEANHGHNWDVDVFVRGNELDEVGILVDFRKLRKAAEETIADVDHTDLNTLDFFRDRNPSSENIAKFLYRRLAAAIDGPGRKVSRVSVHETPGSVASYWE